MPSHPLHLLGHHQPLPHTPDVCSVFNNDCLRLGSRCIPDAMGQDCVESDPRLCVACAGGATLTQDLLVRGA